MESEFYVLGYSALVMHATIQLYRGQKSIYLLSGVIIVVPLYGHSARTPLYKGHFLSDALVPVQYHVCSLCVCPFMHVCTSVN